MLIARHWPALAAALGCVLLLAWSVSRPLRRVRSSLARRAAFALLPLPLAAAWLLLAVLFAGLASEGPWQCAVCGREIVRERWAGIVLATSDAPVEGHCEEVSEPFRRWWEREVAIEHDHDWIRRGCHTRGIGGVACSFDPYDVWYRSLPRIPDRALAAAAATKLAKAGTSARRELMLAVQREAPSSSLARGSPLTEAEFRRAYETWLASHPEWR